MPTALHMASAAVTIERSFRALNYLPPVTAELTGMQRWLLMRGRLQTLGAALGAALFGERRPSIGAAVELSIFACILPHDHQEIVKKSSSSSPRAISLREFREMGQDHHHTLKEGERM